MDMIRLIGAGALAFSLSAAAADRTVTENWTLTQNETIDGALIVPSGVTVDLNGFKLTAQGLHSGSAPILTDGDSVQYEQLEYVITTGGQYVQTTYTPANTDRAEILVEFSDNSNGFLFSTRDNNYKNAFSCYRKSNAVTRFDLSETQKDLSISTEVNGNRYYVVINANDPVGGSTGTGFVRANDAGATSFGYVSIPKGTFAPKGPFVLFAASHWVNGVLEPGSTAYPGKCKFYHFKVTNGDAVKCNIVPAKRVSDGVVGLFDTVAGKFLLARLADNTQAETSFAQYGEMEAEGGTVTSDNFSHTADLTVNEPARVSCNYTSFAAGAYAASVLFNNNYTRQGDTSHRILLNLNEGYDSLPFAVDYDFGDGTQQIVNAYKLWFGTAGTSYVGRAPKAWKFYGSNDKDNNDWTLLDERTSETGWDYNNKARTYSFANDVPYRWYRLEITATNGGDNFMELTQIEYFRTGRLCINVPDGTSTTNSAISITGGVVVEKDGPGTLNMAKKNDGFGGNGVTTLVVKNGKVTRTPNKILATCGAAKSTIQVLDGGQFDLAGFNYYDYKYTIAGDGPDGRGAIVNDVLAAGHQNQGTWYADIWHGFLGDVTLADDATIGGSETFGMLYYAAAVGGSYAASAMTMNGHTLTYAMPAPKAVFSWSMYNYNGEGRILVAEGCQISFTMGDANRPTSAPNCELAVAGTLNQNNQGATVKSLSFTATGIYTHSTVKPITVYEKYAPNINSTENKNKHPTVTLGASGHTDTTLDLSLFSDTFDSSFTTFYSGSTVTVDTGSRELSDGMKLVSWSSQPGADFVLKDGEEKELEVFKTQDGLYLRSTATPAYAMWDSDGGDWKYYASDDTEMPGWTGGMTSMMEVRFSSAAEYAAITNAIEVSHISPGAYRLVSLPLEEGSAEIDLSGLDFIVDAGFSLDVKGNSLKLPNSLVGGSIAFTVTSSVAGGKLVVDVPENGTLVNSSVTLAGSLRLVKTGKGLFTPGKTSQTYTGGTEVADGTLKCSFSGDARALGAANGEIKISADAEAGSFGIFDVNGKYNFDGYHFILNGGRFENSSTATDTQTYAQLANMTLTADSSFHTSGDYGFIGSGYGDTTLDLGGHTLTVSSDKDFYLCKTTVRNGTLQTTGSWILFGRDGNDGNNWHVWFSNVVFVCGQPIKGRCTAHFEAGSVYQADYTGGWNYNSQKVLIGDGGAFRPGAHNYYRSTEMYSGSILDLSRRTAALPVTSAFSASAYAYNQGGSLSFIADATIKVRLGDAEGTLGANVREIARNGGYIVTWGSAPSATFEFADDDPAALRGYALEKAANGLKVVPKRGFTIRIAENKGVTVPGEWVVEKMGESFGTQIVDEWLGGTGANGLPRWQSWLLGLEPADASSVVLCVPGRVNTAEGEFAIGANVDVQAGSGAAVTAYLDTSADGKAWDEKVASQALSDGGTVSFSRTLASGERGFYRIRLAVQ